MIIFIYGEDSYSATQRLEAMRDRFREKFDQSGMNLVEFSAKNLNIGDVSQAIQSPGFLSDKRMVIVKNLLSEVTRKPDAKPWVAQLNKCPSETILILFDSQSEKKIEKNEVFKQLSKSGEFHAYPCPALSVSDLEKWAARESKQLGLSIDRQLLQRVVSLVGADLWQLSGELQKLSAYTSGRATTSEDIQLLVKANFEDKMFDFIDAVAERRVEHALRLLDEQRESGSTDFHLFAMLGRQVRLLIGARDVLDRNNRATKQDIASELGAHPFVAQKLLNQARAFSAVQLRGIHRLLFNFDQRAKTGGGDMSVFVDRTVAEMAVQS